VISAELNIAIDNAFKCARERRHAGITVEHLLLQLLGVSTVQERLSCCGVNASALRTELEDCVSQTEVVSESEFEDTMPTFAFQKAIQYAVLMVLGAERQEVIPIDVLEAVISHSEDLALNPMIKRRIASIK